MVVGSIPITHPILLVAIFAGLAMRQTGEGSLDDALGKAEL